MAFKDTWTAHLTAGFSGDGLSNKLAQDFWSEDLFNPKAMVSYHWLKLVWVYCVSGFMQVTVIAILIGIASTLYHNGGSDWTWAWIIIAGATVFAWALGIVVASAAWLDLKRHAHQRAIVSQVEPEAKSVSSQADAPDREEDDPVIGDQWKRPGTRGN
jgi:hypothetical protein